MSQHRVSHQPASHLRVLVFRDALTNLLESLEAVAQVAGPSPPGQAPEAVPVAASQLQARLASGGRLAAGKFAGNVAETSRVASICEKINQLDRAYLVYCRQLRENGSPADALRGLTSAIADARSGMA